MFDVAERDVPRPTLEELRALEPDAWEQLYRIARPTLWRFARSRLATTEQTEDAVSETMVRAMSAVHRYRHRAGADESGAIIGWMVGIERNVINEVYRHTRRMRAVPAQRDTGAAESWEGVVAADEAHSLRLAFAGLPVADQDLLGLRVIGRLDTDAAAAALGKRPGAMRMAQSRALSRLRTLLNEVDRER